jgi:UDP:flavonoid glycosyltransferase YjiC (YdhE family)
LATGVFPLDDIPVDQLDAAIRQACTDLGRRQRAMAWKAQIEGERGVAVAADSIEKHLHWLRCQHVAL